jgi:phosphoribosylformylglycinamidine synthase
MALSRNEIQLIESTLGRPMLPIERSIFESLWSEHCSYRHSRPFLKHYQRTHRFGAMGVGQNAGGVRLSSGKQVFFKIESHNHPSYVEPKEGAATGVGGILRDIFAMGARPIAMGDLFCFGIPDSDPWMKKLVSGVVKGISDYGNAIGIPNVGGDTRFDARYQNNILVNVFALGIRDSGLDISARFDAGRVQGEWDIHVFGSKTGRDGIGGAAMASEAFGGMSQHKRPQVQISDPYMGKRILEISLALVRERRVVALQDCGAAGMAGAILELCFQNQAGAKWKLDEVPLRVQGMSPDEIAVSESQERMVAIAPRHERPHVQSLCRKWDVPWAVIGELIPDRNVEIYFHGERLTSLRPDFVCEGHTSLYRHVQPADLPSWQSLRAAGRGAEWKDVYLAKKPAESLADLAARWVEDLAGCSRDWIVHQYDQHVGGRTVLSALQHSVGVQLATEHLHLESESDILLGIRLSLSPDWFERNPRVGSWQMLRDAVWHLKSLRLKPIGVTNGLNFASPEVPETLLQFEETVLGLAEAAEAYQLPVVSGNVSFYNAADSGKGIAPTLALGVVAEGSRSHFPWVSKQLPTRAVMVCVRDSEGGPGLPWGRSWTREELNGLLGISEGFEAALWKALEPVDPIRVFQGHLKPIWFQVLGWLLRQDKLPSVELTNLEWFDITTLGGRCVWVLLPEGQTLAETDRLMVEKVGSLFFDATGPSCVLRGKSSPRETLDLRSLKERFDSTLVRRCGLQERP